MYIYIFKMCIYLLFYNIFLAARALRLDDSFYRLYFSFIFRICLRRAHVKLFSVQKCVDDTLLCVPLPACLLAWLH